MQQHDINWMAWNHPHRAGKDEVSIFLGGDFFPDPASDVARELIAGHTANVLGEVAECIQKADLAIVNLECPLTRHRGRILKTGPHMKAPPAVAAALRNAGVGAVCLANNHILDYEVGGLVDTLAALRSARVRNFGADTNRAQASRPLICRRKGITIALLALAENEFSTARNGTGGAAPQDPAANCRSIRDAATRADLVVVFAHGGQELSPIPSPDRVHLYRQFLIAGADAVLGSHSHVPQGVELFKGKPIVYSFGNLLFPSHKPRPPLWQRGFAMQLTASRRGVAHLDILPLDNRAEHGRRVRAAVHEQAVHQAAYIRTVSDLLAQPETHRKLWNSWCARHGVDYAQKLSEGVVSDDPVARALCENLIRCEAHREVLLTYIRLCQEERLPMAEGDAQLLHSLTHPAFALRD